MSETVRIGRRFTVVIPKAIRKRLRVSEGQEALIRVEEGKLVIEPLPADPYGVLQRIMLGEPYDESNDEKRTEDWLKQHAGR
jgi:AbrB family looped-hinge helix DNA binding protein